MERGDARHGARARTSPSCSRSATPPATGAMSWRTRASSSPRSRRLMNRLFVNIKVDREERPDLDTVYQQALAVMGQQGGWPLTMFLTPERRAVLGRHLLPARAALRPAGLRQVLEQVAELWRSRQRTASTSNRDCHRAARCSSLSAPEAGEHRRTRPWPSGWHAQIAEHFDTVHGGLAGAPKFPQAPLLRLIWDTALRTGDQTLRQRIAAHARPHLARAASTTIWAAASPATAVDAYWLVPHFEKMLYDNAQLLRAAGLGLGRHRASRCSRPGPRRRWLAAARDAGRRRLRLLARRRQRGRGGPVLCLGRRPRSTASWEPTRPPSALPTASPTSGNWEGSNVLQPPA